MGGDKEFKPEGSKSNHLISSEPDIITHNVNWDEDDFVILGSDGIWDVVPDEVAVKMVQDSLGSGKDEVEAAKEVLKYANDKGSTDDKTAMVVNLGNLKRELE